MFWIFRATGSVLGVFDRKTNRVKQYTFRHSQDPSITPTGIMAMLEDRNGTLWIATHRAGLLKFDRSQRRFIRYGYDPADPDSLPQDDVENLSLDREGHVWAGLGRKGVVRFATNHVPFRNVPGLSSNRTQPFVGAIYEDQDGILWIGTPAELKRIDRRTMHSESYRLVGPEKNSDITTICEDRSRNLWIGTYRHGLFRFDPRTRRIKAYRHNPADPQTLSNDIVTRLFVDRGGTVWAATADGLNQFEPKTDSFRVYRAEQGRNLFYLDVAEDAAGALWLGTEFGGVYRFERQSGEFTAHYEHDSNRPGTLSNNRVNSVHFDRSGTMWVATQNGLNKFDPKTGTFSVYTKRNGLPGNTVGRILEDARGGLWMSTNNGLATLNPQRDRFKSYSIVHGLPGQDLTGWGAGCKGMNGELFFGGFSGATVFSPDKVADAADHPPIVVTEVRLFGDPLQIGGDSPLRLSPAFARELTFTHRQNVFSLGFAALSYQNPATNRYRYKLDGLDHSWIEVGSDRRQVTYTTLPAATYTFNVQAATSTGAWSEPGVSVSIRILPPIWSTWWFRTAALALVLTGLWYAHWRRLREIARVFNIRLEERVDERTRIARALHDTLLQSFQGLMYRLQAARNMLPERPTEAMRTLDGALVRAEEAIADSREAIQQLRSGPTADCDLARLLTALGEDLADFISETENRPAFRVMVEGPPRRLHPTVQDEIYGIASEVLRNAFQHAQARAIECEIRYSDRALQIRFRDDGRGIDREVLDAGGRARHWGLTGIQERATRISGRLDIWTKQGAGTEIELIIPAIAAYLDSPRQRAFVLIRRRNMGDA
ncbi:MAG TPA: two-component regulator propeller domain-containing protein [Bryobacteraceae bacterium]|nr:two-component regulator propeller domain-containing protein [Bryobacteraceae bacterium]